MASNSIAPSVKAVDLYLDGGSWKLRLLTANGATVIGLAETTVGDVTVAIGGSVTLPLSLRALGGDAAHELRIFGGGELKVIHAQQLSGAFPCAGLTVVSGEVVAQQIESIVEIGAGITRISIAWGG